MPEFNINEIDKQYQWLFRKKPNKVIPLLPTINRDEFNEAIFAVGRNTLGIPNSPAEYEQMFGKSITSEDFRAYSNKLNESTLDAYRHVFASAYVSILNNEAFSRDTFNTYEKYLSRGDWSSHNMDYWNNEVGYAIAKYMKTHNISLNELPDIVAKVVESDWAISDRFAAAREGRVIYNPGTETINTDMARKVYVNTLLIVAFEPEQVVFDDVFENMLGISKTILQRANKMYDIATTYFKAFFTISPLILDLDGDGVETLSINNGINFDHNADGFSELTGWAGKDDGLLVLDINGNGLIDSGRELFGEHTLLSNGEEASGGFEALAELDSNLDGKIDANDTQFSDLKIWIDANSDGITDSGELHTLGELNIESISLNFENVNKEDAEGNLISQAGSYTTTDQVTHDLSDIKFQVDNVFLVL